MENGKIHIYSFDHLLVIFISRIVSYIAKTYYLTIILNLLIILFYSYYFIHCLLILNLLFVLLLSEVIKEFNVIIFGNLLLWLS